MRIAVLIAYADREPFKSLRKQAEEKILEFYKNMAVDVYFVSGKRAGPIEEKLRDKLESIRWTRFFVLLRVFDYLALAKYKWEIAKYQKRDCDIRVDVAEDIRHLTPKLLSAFKCMTELEYEWVVRTTIFSFINFKRLSSELGKLHTNKPIMGGRMVHQRDKTSFISGSFMVLNKKAMQIILMNRKLIDFGLIDDVAFSRLGKRLSFEIHELSSIDIRSVTQLYETTVDKLAKYCHVRGRSEIKQDTDMEIFLEILEKVL